MEGQGVPRPGARLCVSEGAHAPPVVFQRVGCRLSGARCGGGRARERVSLAQRLGCAHELGRDLGSQSLPLPRGAVPGASQSSLSVPFRAWERVDRPVLSPRPLSEPSSPPAPFRRGDKAQLTNCCLGAPPTADRQRRKSRRVPASTLAPIPASTLAPIPPLFGEWQAKSSNPGRPIGPPWGPSSRPKRRLSELDPKRGGRQVGAS